jgi:hypothetical protein
MTMLFLRHSRGIRWPAYLSRSAYSDAATVLSTKSGPKTRTSARIICVFSLARCMRTFTPLARGFSDQTRAWSLRGCQFGIDALAFGIALCASKRLAERGAIELIRQVAAKSFDLGFRCHARLSISVNDDSQNTGRTRDETLQPSPRVSWGWKHFSLL